MSSKKSYESQQLTLMQKDISLKRKFVEQAEPVDKEFLAHAKKMMMTMDRMTDAITGCLETMQRMCAVQMQHQRFSFGNQNPVNYAMSATPSNHQDSYHQDLQYNVGHSARRSQTNLSEEAFVNSFNMG